MRLSRACLALSASRFATTVVVVQYARAFDQIAPRCTRRSCRLIKTLNALTLVDGITCMFSIAAVLAGRALHLSQRMPLYEYVRDALSTNRDAIDSNSSFALRCFPTRTSRMRDAVNRMTILVKDPQY